MTVFNGVSSVFFFLFYYQIKFLPFQFQDVFQGLNRFLMLMLWLDNRVPLTYLLATFGNIA